jgi:hypothetical protein
MRPFWVTPRLAPSPITLARTWRATMRIGVIGAVADIGIVLAGVLDVGADAAEPEQIGLHRQDRGHDVLAAWPCRV